MTDTINNNKVIIRKATADDIDVLIRMRVDFRTQEGKLTAQEADDIKDNLRNFYTRNIGTKSFTAIICECEGEAVSIAFLSVADRPPRKPDIPSNTATVYNVFTYPQHRGNGYATMVMKELLKEAKAQGIGYVDLLATEAGKPLYEKLGFEESIYTPMSINIEL